MSYIYGPRSTVRSSAGIPPAPRPQSLWLKPQAWKNLGQKKYKKNLAGDECPKGQGAKAKVTGRFENVASSKRRFQNVFTTSRLQCVRGAAKIIQNPKSARIHPASSITMSPVSRPGLVAWRQCRWDFGTFAPRRVLDECSVLGVGSLGHRFTGHPTPSTRLGCLGVGCWVLGVGCWCVGVLVVGCVLCVHVSHMHTCTHNTQQSWMCACV